MDDRVKGQSDETNEWLDALDSVEAFEEIAKVDDILDAVVTSARRKGAKLPFAANTAYVNTIAPQAEPPIRRPRRRPAHPPLCPLECGGDGGQGERGIVSSFGGHIASFQSAATPVRHRGSMHFLACLQRDGMAAT